VLGEVTGWRLIGSVLLSLMFPGFGQGLAARRHRTLAWALADVGSTFAIIMSVWFFWVAILVRLAAPIDAYFCLRRHHGPTQRTLPAIAIVIGAIGLGYAQLAIEAFKIPSSSMYPTLVIGDSVYVDKLSVRWRPPERGEIIVFTQPCAQVPYIKRVIALAGDTVEVRCNVVYVNGEPIENELVIESDSYKDYDESSRAWSARNTSRYRERLGGHTYETFHDRDAPMRDKQQIADTHDFPKRDRMFAPSCQQGDFYEPKPGVKKQPVGTLVVTKPVASPCEQQAHFVVPANALFVMGDNRNIANDSRYWGAVSLDAVIGRAIGIWLNNPPNGGERAWSRLGSIE